MRYSFFKAFALLLLGSVLMTAAGSASVAAEAGQSTNGDDSVLLSSLSMEPLSGSEMEKNRGAAAVINTLSSSQSLEAATSGNTLSVGGSLTNGDVSLGDNMGGFGSYVMNTGNNSTINSAVSLSVQIMPSP